MTRPKFLRRLDSVNPPYRLIELDGSLNDRGRRAVQHYRERRPASKRRIRRDHKEALKIDREMNRDMLEQEAAYAMELYTGIRLA